MTAVVARIHVASDGTLSGRAPGLPSGDHDAEIALVERDNPPSERNFHRLLDRVHALQKEIARLPVFDGRSPDEIIGYTEQGHLD